MFWRSEGPRRGGPKRRGLATRRAGAWRAEGPGPGDPKRRGPARAPYSRERPLRAMTEALAAPHPSRSFHAFDATSRRRLASNASTVAGWSPWVASLRRVQVRSIFWRSWYRPLSERCIPRKPAARIGRGRRSRRWDLPILQAHRCGPAQPGLGRRGPAALCSGSYQASRIKRPRPLPRLRPPAGPARSRFVFGWPRAKPPRRSPGWQR